MKSWQKKKLGELCDLITKGTTPTSIGYKFTDKGIKFIKVESLTELGEIIPSKVAFIDEECHDALKRSQLKANDILFSIAGALGRIGIVRDEIIPANTNQALAIIRLKSDSGVLVNYLAKYFNSNQITDEIEKLRGGAAQQNLSLTQLSNLDIPLPPLSEQKRIVTILDEAFAAIAKAKANAEQNLKNAKELFESYLQGVFENKGESWEEKTLKELTTHLGDGLHGTPKYTLEGDYYFINGNNLTDGLIELKSNTKRVSFEEYNKHKKNLTDRTILVSINGTLGNVAFYNNEKIILGKSACYFNMKEGVDKNYIKYVLSSPYFLQYAQKEATGATIKNVSLKTMREFIVPLPSLKLQKVIVDKLEALSAETKKLEAIYQQKINDLEELKKSVLQKAFSGELKTAKVIA
ncbi:MAG TPA: restriction endonuclease subunit S [Bacteroidia bacterium]|nr:restriction endonuclease subunit S [Bacteroidia bacterium]HRH08289.1 restriction endonuclease subunit S [Bacteroidia bacterium]